MGVVGSAAKLEVVEGVRATVGERNPMMNL
jgi:hypothetical protein